MNKLILIGFNGIKSCYLNISLEDAINRYCKKERVSKEYVIENDLVSEITFKDEFGAYDVYDECDEIDP
jgi:hypothetical protein